MTPLIPSIRSTKFPYLFPAAGSLMLGIYGLLLCFGLPGGVIAQAEVLPFLTYSFSTDGLAGFFIMIISVLSFCASIYCAGYYNSGSEKMPFVLFNLFILSMYAVAAASNIPTFLIAWETMSLSSYFLVTLRGDDSSAKAGLLYIVMTHIGTAFIIVMFLLLFESTGSMEFNIISSAAETFSFSRVCTIFLLSLVGFGTKAGLIPLHIWLPKAHPAAPSAVSALMSGVMIKMGIYGFIRINFTMLISPPDWFGIVLIVLGAVSCIFGVLYAYMEQDIKRLLAYSSIENIGIIFLGLGVAMLFRSGGFYALSALAATAAMYHIMNHAFFKGLLFLGSGAVLHSAHTVNMERLGGLIKLMPWTALFFLTGAVTISALPPFSGFVSEWMTFQSLLLGFNSQSMTAKIAAPLGGAALALTGALSAACFVKAFGISFLGSPRSNESAAATETHPLMLVSMGLLSILCLAGGILPGLAVNIVSGSVFMMTGTVASPAGWHSLFIDRTFSSLSPSLILLTVMVMAGAAFIFVLFVSKRRSVRKACSWDCGIRSLDYRMQYSAAAFSKPIKLIFKRIYLPSREVRISYLLKPLFVRSMTYRGRITQVVEKYVYDKIAANISRTANRIKVLQSGNLNLYLGYILLTLIFLLIFWT
ncbi:MAG: proton-conducting transporter membrane subunit [Dissulfurispiraceae bacterium]|nr:proton-conducting transporter membrane subunit [Dissulfurispiraceae bacterium]